MCDLFICLVLANIWIEHTFCKISKHMDRVKRIWYLSPMQAAKVQASLHIRAVSPEPSLLAPTSSESRGTFRQKTRSLALLNCWACAVKVCHDGMLEDINSLGGAHMKVEHTLCKIFANLLRFGTPSCELKLYLWPLKEILFGWKWTFSIILLYYEANEVNISILSQ